MVKKEIYIREGKDKPKKKYFFHESYSTFDEARVIGKYYKKEEGSKYYILIDKYGKEDEYHLYLDNMWNAI